MNQKQHTAEDKNKYLPSRIAQLRHRIVFALGKHIAKLWLWKYHFHTDRVPKQPEPFLMMANHTTETDMIMAAAAVKQHMYFVCGEHLLRGKFGRPIKRYVDPVPIPKGGASFTAVKAILARIKAGFNIMIFPEGSRSFHGETIPVELATGKLVKLAKCTLVTYRIHGGYFIAPRWGYRFRKGRAWAEVVGIYSSQELKQRSAQEITDLINRDLYENAYETQRQVMTPYTGEKLAEGLENYLILCPKCHQYDTMTSQGNSFSCSNCGAGGTYDQYGFLRGDTLEFDSVYDWGKWIETEFDRDMDQRADPAARQFLDRDVRLYEIADGTTRDLAQGDLALYLDRMVLGEKTFPYERIEALSMLYYGKTLLFTMDGHYYGITGERFHAWKASRLYQRSRSHAEAKMS